MVQVNPRTTKILLAVALFTVLLFSISSHLGGTAADADAIGNGDESANASPNTGLNPNSQPAATVEGLSDTHDHLPRHLYSQGGRGLPRGSSFHETGAEASASSAGADGTACTAWPTEAQLNRSVVLLWSGDGYAAAPTSMWHRTGSFFLGYTGAMHTRPPCDVQCFFVTDMAYAATADAILWDLPGHHHKYGFVEAGQLNTLPPVKMPDFKPLGQQWVVHHYEQASQFPVIEDPATLSRFDLAMDYHQDAAVPVTFHFFPGYHTDPNYHAVEEALLRPHPPKERGKIAAYFASRPSAGRDNYVLQLQAAGLTVHSFGAVLNNAQMPQESPGSWPRGWALKMQELGKFKFLLCFENGNFSDWVTEKMPHAIMAGTVPVYMGASNILDFIPGEDAIIRVSDFAGPAALAAHLLKLDADDALYERHFAWKKRGLSPNFRTNIRQNVFDSNCRLCRHVLQRRCSPPAPLVAAAKLEAESAAHCDPTNREAAHAYVKAVHELRPLLYLRFTECSATASPRAAAAASTAAPPQAGAAAAAVFSYEGQPLLSSVVGPLAVTPPAVSPALLLDGFADSIRLAPFYTHFLHEATIEFFVWISARGFPSKEPRGVFHGDQWRPGQLHMFFLEDRLHFAVHGNQYEVNAGESFPKSFVAERWYHLAVSYSVAQRLAVLHVDGDEAASIRFTSAQPLLPLNQPSRLSGWADRQERFFSGKLAEFAVYNSFLSSAVLRHHFAMAHQR